MFKLLATLGNSLILLSGCTSNPQLIAQLTEECKTLGNDLFGAVGRMGALWGRAASRAMGQGRTGQRFRWKSDNQWGS